MNYDEPFALIIPIAGSYVVTTGHSNQVKHTETFPTFKQALKFLDNTQWNIEGKTAETRLQHYVYRMVEE